VPTPPTSSTTAGAPGVLLVVPWDQTQGGVNTIVRNLGRALREEGREPLFLFPGSSIAPREGMSRLGFPAVYMNLRPPVVERRPLVSALGFAVTAPAVLWQLVRLIHRRGIEVVNVHYPGPSAAILVALRRLTGIRLVTSVHGSDLTSLRPESRELDWIAKLLRQSNAIIAPSSAYGDFVRREFPGAAGRVVAVPNGVDVDAIEVMATDPNVAPPAPARAGTPYFVCVAAFNPKKAHDTLLRAFARVPAPYRLLLAGDGPLRRDVERLIGELGIEDRVVLLGEQPPAMVAKLLAGAVSSVLPSRDEPFGIAAVESMVVGTPVVATNVGGLAEIVEHERTGLAVPADDPDALAAALTRIAGDAPLRERLGNAARETARARFDRREWAERYLAVLRGDRPAAPAHG
jgi:glycosyltransferase involved in cell wall biosynthesis